MEQTTAPLILRHRPAEFAAMRGNTAALGALKRRLDEPQPPHTFLFTGPSGVGKTSAARITAGVLDAEIIEVDAATHSGVDDMRSLLQHANVVARVNRMFIIDECQRLTGNAWDAALKTLEEPPPWLYFSLCTTEIGKLPRTIVTRSCAVKLDPLTEREIEEVLCDVITAEGWGRVVNKGVYQLILTEAGGSARQALSLLQICYDAENIEEARRIIETHGSPEPMIQILQMLLRGEGGWDHIRPLLAQLPTDFSEAALIQAGRYISGWMVREPDAAKAARQWEVLAGLVYPAHSYDSRSLFVAAVGRLLWSAA